MSDNVFFGRTDVADLLTRIEGMRGMLSQVSDEDLMILGVSTQRFSAAIIQENTFRKTGVVEVGDQSVEDLHQVVEQFMQQVAKGDKGDV